jgi:hypothetical protein
MVRTSLRAAEPWLRQHRVTLKPVPGRGFELVGPIESMRTLAESIRRYDQPRPCFAPALRLLVVLVQLFLGDGPRQVKQLQGALGLSRQHLRVLDAAGVADAAWARLSRRQNYGFHRGGAEGVALSACVRNPALAILAAAKVAPSKRLTSVRS